MCQNTPTEVTLRKEEMFGLWFQEISICRGREVALYVIAVNQKAEHRTGRTVLHLAARPYVPEVSKSPSIVDKLFKHLVQTIREHFTSKA